MGDLVGPSDHVVAQNDEPVPAGPWLGRCWCPTPSALSALRAVGVEPPLSPSFDVLRRVNDKRFAARLTCNVADTFVVDDEDAWSAFLESREPNRTWLLKRAFGFAGRGQVVAHDSDLESEPMMRWVRAAVRGAAGFVVEPFASRILDVALHGHLSRSGVLELGEPIVSSIGAARAWASSRRAREGELHGAEISALCEAIEGAAGALVREGYFGPFGIDGFRHSAGDGEAFVPICDLNARYSMAWAIGMGEKRPDRAPDP